MKLIKFKYEILKFNKVAAIVSIFLIFVAIVY